MFWVSDSRRKGNLTAKAFAELKLLPETLARSKHCAYGVFGQLEQCSVTQ
jgi:hypothetical protein